MGTRNLTIVQKNGEYKVAQYGQWDGYPEGLGITLLTFLKNINMDSFREIIDTVSFYSKEEIDDINHKIKEMQEAIPSYSWQQHYPHLSRDCGGDILTHIVFKGVKKLENSLDFAADSLFCEWAYVIDLDKNKFEIYKGFNEEPLLEDERFYFLEEKCKDKRYHPVKLVKAYDIDNLPKKDLFVSELTE